MKDNYNQYLESLLEMCKNEQKEDESVYMTKFGFAKYLGKFFLKSEYIANGTKHYNLNKDRIKWFIENKKGEFPEEASLMTELLDAENKCIMPKHEAEELLEKLKPYSLQAGICENVFYIVENFEEILTNGDKSTTSLPQRFYREMHEVAIKN